MIRSSRFSFSMSYWLLTASQKLLGVEAGWIHGGIDEDLHQGSHDLVTRKFDVENWFAGIDFLAGNQRTFLIGLALMLGDMFDETSLESAGKNLLFVIPKNVDAFVLQLSDYTGTHVHHLLVFIGQPLIQDSLANLLLCFLIKESQQ